MPDGRPFDPDELRRMTEAIGQARAPGGFEFDVINRERDALAALKREQSERDAQSTNSRVEQVRAALAEFLRRMNGAGNPGTNEEFKTGFMKKIRGWSISYTAGGDAGPRSFHTKVTTESEGFATDSEAYGRCR
jgi:hypothetical protein